MVRCKRLPLRDELGPYTKRFVDRPCACIPGSQRSSMLPRSRANQRVVDGATGDADSRKLSDKICRICITEKFRCRKVASQDEESIGR